MGLDLSLRFSLLIHEIRAHDIFAKDALRIGEAPKPQNTAMVYNFPISQIFKYLLNEEQCMQGEEKSLVIHC